MMMRFLIGLLASAIIIICLGACSHSQVAIDKENAYNWLV